MLTLKKGSALKVRYLIKFSKESDIKFISHLDLMRTIQKVIRRAELPIEYSKGFNPHMSLSIAQPLSVGTYSTGEYMDIVLLEEVNEKEIISRLNEKCPRGIKILEAKKIIQIENEKKVPQAMALVDAASYTIKIKYEALEGLEAEVEALLKKPEWNTIKKSKNGEKEVNIRPMIKDFKYWLKDEYLVINTLISCGSRENLSADLLAEYIKANTSNANQEAFVNIKREEIFALKNNKLVPLFKYV